MWFIRRVSLLTFYMSVLSDGKTMNGILIVALFLSLERNIERFGIWVQLSQGIGLDLNVILLHFILHGMLYVGADDVYRVTFYFPNHSKSRIKTWHYITDKKLVVDVN